MKVRLKAWNNAGYHFTLDWLLRSVNTVLTGEAKFKELGRPPTHHAIQGGHALLAVEQELHHLREVRDQRAGINDLR